MPKGVPFPPAVIARAKRLNAAGLCDREIAERMADVFPPGKAGYYAVKQIRRRHGWPLRCDAESRRRAVANQRAGLGIRNYRELRRVAHERYAERCGWPDDLPVRAVQVLNLLATRGAMTARQLAEAIGMRTDRRKGRTASNAALLYCSARSPLCRGHGTYTGLLIARGLVAALARSNGYGRGRAPTLYSLTAPAVLLRMRIHDDRQ